MVAPQETMEVALTQALALPKVLVELMVQIFVAQPQAHPEVLVREEMAVAVDAAQAAAAAVAVATMAVAVAAPNPEI